MDCPRFTRCVCCGQCFTDFNTFSDAGWIETQISGLCEVCYDVLSAMPRREDDEHGGDDD